MNFTDTVQLWIDNDQRLYSDVLDVVRDSGSTNPFVVAEGIRDVVDGFLPTSEGLASDLLTRAMAEVEWDVLASDYLEVIADDLDDTENEEN